MRLRAARFPTEFARFATLGVAHMLVASLAGAQSTAVRRPTTLRQTPTAATISRARLERVLGASTADIRVVRETGVSDLPRSQGTVSVRQGDFVFRKLSDTATRVRATATADARFTMPYRWLTVDSTGTERVLIPYFVLVGGGLTYDVSSRQYRGTALVGVEDTLHPNDGPIQLARALRLQLTTTSGGTVTPSQLAIAHTSLDYDSVRIEATDSTNVAIRTGADPRGIVVRVPVRSITLSLIPQQATLQSLGLATTDIAVTLPRGMSRGDTAVVTFSSTSAPVRPSTVRVSGEGATVRLRSGLPGQDSIRAFVDGVFAGETVVHFTAPWAFLSATIVGLVLGGVARFYGGKRLKKARYLGRDILRGAPFGILVAAASAIGLDLMHLRIDDPGTWIAVMITAALGASAGARVIEKAVAAPATS